MGRNQVHELNRDHIAAGIAEMLADLRPMLWKRFRDEFEDWRVPPFYACVFGSAARGDGGVDSDIDLLLVHPLLPGEKRLPSNRAPLQRYLDARTGVAVIAADPDADRVWEEQIDELRNRAQAWTGNPLQVVDLSLHQWLRPAASHQVLLAALERDGVELSGSRRMASAQVGR